MRPPTIPRARARRPAHRAPAAHGGAARLLRDARGATIVEFAMVVIPFIALMLASTAAAVFPVMLTSTIRPEFTLTAYNASAGALR